jgi:hypothetical protein
MTRWSRRFQSLKGVAPASRGIVIDQVCVPSAPMGVQSAGGRSPTLHATANLCVVAAIVSGDCQRCDLRGGGNTGACVVTRKRRCPAAGPGVAKPPPKRGEDEKARGRIFRAAPAGSEKNTHEVTLSRERLADARAGRRAFDPGVQHAERGVGSPGRAHCWDRLRPCVLRRSVAIGADPSVSRRISCHSASS